MGRSMAKVLLYYVHPGQNHSQAGAALWAAAKAVDGITRVDLYGEYPRFHISIEKEQARLLDHDVIVLQYPVFWYATPALLKEWQDLVLEHGFAYGTGGNALAGKALQLAVTAAGPEDAYRAEGYQGYALREFLRPLEQTARLCQMQFPAPFAVFAALKTARDDGLAAHAAAYRRLLEGLRDDTHPSETAAPDALLTADTFTEAL